MRSQRGAVLFLTFLLMFLVTGLAVAAATLAQNSQMTGKSQFLDKAALYIAEAGQQRARQTLVAGTWTASASPGTTYTESFGAGEYRVTIVDLGGNQYSITSEGYVPSQAVSAAKRRLLENSINVTVSNGTNQSLTATATASSTNGSNVASNAKDGSNSTKWKAGTDGSNEWLRMDFGGSPPTLNKIVIGEDANIDGVSIQFSSNGSSWSTASGLSVVESPSKTWTATFTAASYRYARALFPSSGSSKKVSVNEMQSYNASISALGAGEVTTSW